MNQLYGSKVSGAGKRFSPRVLSLVVGLALMLWGSVALAINNTISGVDIVVKPGGGKQVEPAGLAGQPIPGVDIKLGKNPPKTGSVAVVRTDKNGSFEFKNLPEGNYELTIPGQPSKSLTVGPEGKVGGNLMQGSDGQMTIFDRWGEQLTETSPKDAGSAGSEGPAGLAAEKQPIPGVDTHPALSSKGGKGGGIADQADAGELGTNHGAGLSIGEPIPGVDIVVKPGGGRQDELTQVQVKLSQPPPNQLKSIAGRNNDAKAQQWLPPVPIPPDSTSSNNTPSGTDIILNTGSLPSGGVAAHNLTKEVKNPGIRYDVSNAGTVQWNKSVVIQQPPPYQFKDSGVNGPSAKVNQPIITKDVDNLPNTKHLFKTTKSDILPQNPAGTAITYDDIKTGNGNTELISIDIKDYNLEPGLHSKVTNDREKINNTSSATDRGAKSAVWLPPVPIPPGERRTPSKFPPGSGGILVRLVDASGHVRVSSKTDKGGAFNFSDVPEGKYKLKLADFPDQSVVIGSDRKFGGTLITWSDGQMTIFDRWGNLLTDTTDKGARSGGPASQAIDVVSSDKDLDEAVGELKKKKDKDWDEAVGDLKEKKDANGSSPAGFGTGMNGSPGRGPDLGSMGGGMNPGNMPGGLGGLGNPMTGLGGRANPVMSPGGAAGPGSSMMGGAMGGRP